MSDLIYREAALNCFHSWADKYGDVHTPDEMPEYQAIEGLPSVQPEQRWIPCSERLPNKADHTDDMVLVCYRNGSVRFNTYMNGWAQGNPVAWMPMPEPYREDDHE